MEKPQRCWLQNEREQLMVKMEKKKKMLKKIVLGYWGQQYRIKNFQKVGSFQECLYDNAI